MKGTHMKLTLVKPNHRLKKDINPFMEDPERQFQIRNLKKMIRFMKAQLKCLEKKRPLD